MAGIVGAIFNSGIELGSAVGLAVDASIETGIENHEGPDGFEHYKGRRATFWWLMATCLAVAIAVVVFYRSGGKLEGPATSAPSPAAELDPESLDTKSEVMTHCGVVTGTKEDQETRYGSLDRSEKESFSLEFVPVTTDKPISEEKLEV